MFPVTQAAPRSLPSFPGVIRREPEPDVTAWALLGASGPSAGVVSLSAATIIAETAADRRALCCGTQESTVPPEDRSAWHLDVEVAPVAHTDDGPNAVYLTKAKLLCDYLH